MSACARELGVALPGLLADMFAKVDDALYNLADTAANNRLYTVYFDAMRIIRGRQRSIQLDFLRRLRIAANTAASGLVESDLRPQAPASPEDYALLPEAELDEILAINQAIAKAESLYRRPLMEIEYHLARLLDRESLDARANPFGPAAVCESFRDTIATIRQIESPIRVAVYKKFDACVMASLGPFYDRCVAIAVAGGHKRGEGFAHALRRGTGAAAVVAGHSAGGRGAADPLPEAVALPFETLRELLARQRHAGSPPPARRVTVPTGELLEILGNLGAVSAKLSDVSPDAMRASLGTALAQGAPTSRGLAPQDQDTLDLVFLFFEHLLQGNDLADPIKALIGRMQIPVAKLALIDKGFFSDSKHPARRLLNHIGEAAVGWSEDDERGTDSFYGMIERVVERLILDFDGDPALFAQMDRFFVAFIARERMQTEVTAGPAGAASGERIAHQDPPEVARALDACLARHSTIPPVVDAILRQGWWVAMAGVLRAQGAQSKAWRDGLEIADRLLWSVQPKTDAEERRQLLRRIPETLRGLRGFLAGSGCDQRQLARWLKELQAIHLAVLQDEGAAPGAPPTVSAGRPGVLQVGSWLELERDDGSRIRYKVSRVGADGQTYGLVDRRGRPGPVLASAKLSQLIAQSLARLIEVSAEPIADRALRSVLGRLAR